MGVLLQMQKTENVILSTGDVVLFDQVLLQEGAVLYTDGVVTINESGIFIVQWTVNTMATTTGFNSSFAIVPSNATPIIGDSPHQRNQLSGTAILQADEGGLTFSLVNSLDGMVQLAFDTPIVANLVVFRVNEPIVEIGPNETWVINGEDTHIPVQSCLTRLCNGEAFGSIRGIDTGVEGEDGVINQISSSVDILDYHLGEYAVALGNNTFATGQNSFATNSSTLASGGSSFASGNGTVASGYTSHAEGYSTTASGGQAHAEGGGSQATAAQAHAEGLLTVASQQGTHAEGVYCIASGRYSHAQNSSTQATADASHAEGTNTLASGESSHAQGNSTQATANSTFAGGWHTIAQGHAQTALGRFNIAEGNPSSVEATNNMFIIGNGGSDSTRSDAFRVQYNGDTYAMGTINPGGADYAEMFEWLDGNPDNEERVGYFVTLQGEYIRKATATDGYVLGIVSATPSVVGDNEGMEWKDRFLRDEWGRFVYEESEDGQVPVLNPEYDKERSYLPRSQRPEWSAVGVVGKLKVRQDGSCVAGGFCQPNDDGVATASEAGYYVMKVVSPSIALVVVK